MGTLLARVKGPAAAAALAVMGCNAPDSSALFRPAGPAAIRTEMPGLAAAPALSAGTGMDPEAGAAAPPSTDETSPPGNAVAPDDAREVPLEPPTPTSPTLDAGSAVTPDAVPPDPTTPAPTPDVVPPETVTPDAGSELPPTSPVEPACAGTLLGGLCWYLSELDQTCDAVCATRGGFDAASVSTIGTPLQGGNIEACAAVLAALGQAPLIVTEGFREDGLGFGCHLFVDVNGVASAWWLTAPDFSPAVSDPSARIACACEG